MTRKRQQTRNEKIIAYVMAATGSVVGEDAIERVEAGNWMASHPVDRAILSALDQFGKQKVRVK